MNDERIYYSHDAEMHAMQIRALITVVFLSFGLAIGAGLALLFAPATGKTTRRDIVKVVEDRMQNGREKIEPIIKKAEKDLSKLHDKFD